jgi:hypothetical protein
LKDEVFALDALEKDLKQIFDCFMDNEGQGAVSAHHLRIFVELAGIQWNESIWEDFNHGDQGFYAFIQMVSDLLLF